MEGRRERGREGWTGRRRERGREGGDTDQLLHVGIILHVILLTLLCILDCQVGAPRDDIIITSWTKHWGEGVPTSCACRLVLTVRSHQT